MEKILKRLLSPIIDRLDRLIELKEADELRDHIESNRRDREEQEQTGRHGYF